MTPPSASTAHARSTGHARTSTRRGLSPRGPRRVSGPSRAAGGARAARATRATRTAPRVNGGAVALPTPLIHRLGQIPESRSLDRLLRSRGWIALLGVLLIGLVFMQVSLLKLNAGMGADVERAAALERGNALLTAEVSKLASNDRIQQWAIRNGMVLPTSDNVRYLGSGGKRIGGAAAANMPSQGEATTALLPTIPGDATAQGAAATATTAPTTTTTEPQTTSSVPDAALAQQQADAAAAAAAAQQQQQAQVQPQQTSTPPTPDATATGAAGTTAATGATAPPTAPATTAAATGAATVGGATPGG